MINGAIYKYAFTGGSRKFKAIKVLMCYAPGQIVTLGWIANSLVEEWEIVPLDSVKGTHFYYEPYKCNDNLELIRPGVVNIPKEAI